MVSQSGQFQALGQTIIFEISSPETGAHPLQAIQNKNNLLLYNKWKQ